MRALWMNLVCLTLMGCLATATYATDVAKIGVIDFEKILKGSSAGKAAQAEITQKGNQMKADLEKRGKEIEEMRKKLEKEMLVMDADQRDQKERDFRIKVNDFKSLQKKYTEDFKKFEAKWIKRIRDEVLDLVKRIGEKEHYLLIVEKMGVLYHPNSIDITDKVIQQYNKEFAKK